MQKMDNGYSNLKGRSLACQAGMVSMLLLVLLAANSAKAEDGNHGVLFVHGALTEGACRLDMVSARQDVWLGETATGNLAKVGSVQSRSPSSFAYEIACVLGQPCRTNAGAIKFGMLISQQ
ncbi:hypothetical protein IC615_06225 [Serratia ureilytica]